MSRIVGGLHVGRPNLGDRATFLSRVEEILERRWLSNHGPVVQEFERRVAGILGVKHALAVCNATVGIEIAAHALGLRGEVILPSYTFVATAHALQWLGITPVFCDIDPRTHNLDPARMERHITPRTTGIVGLHAWGRGCNTSAIGEIASSHGLKVMYDASHAFGCTHQGKMIGSFGNCEVFSFHATKFIQALEGGVVATNDDALAHQIGKMRNFGFTGYDRVEHLGINGKMSEISAAMGLTSLEAMDEIMDVNHRNYLAYGEHLSGVPGVSLLEYERRETNNLQYVILEVDPERCPRTRDELVAALHAENIFARKYFWPGCHRMEPYRTLDSAAGRHLPETERVADRVIVLPTGQQMQSGDVERICEIIRGMAGEGAVPW